MRDCVTIAVAARLHLGFLDLHGGLGRRFGSLGVALEEPRTVLELRPAAAVLAEGSQADRALAHLRRLASELKLPSACRLTVREAIPAHAGLGSGTQLALAVAAGLRSLHRLPLDPEGDALQLDRSARSGLGTFFFQHGGVALDGGRGSGDRPAPVISRLPFPEVWRILLIQDPARNGVHGAEELAAFKALPAFSADLAAHLCRLVVMQALPAVAEADLEPFGRAVTEIQAHIGDHFAAAQGGRYASPAVAAALELLARSGIAGYGQSSWGPTGFAFAASPPEALQMQNQLAPLAAASGLSLTIVKGRNRGAAITAAATQAEQGMRHG
jgi:beta-ribofuranosylaminobenzene 5'-phosphate synthase